MAAVAAVTRFASIGLAPPSIHPKPFAHATASTQLLVGERPALSYGKPDTYSSAFGARSSTLADLLTSPGLIARVARAAGLPASKIAVLGPIWVDISREAQWATGPKRSSQIVSESDPYRISLGVQADFPPWGPVIEVATQAPSTDEAARLAAATGVAISAYLTHLQRMTAVPTRDRYEVSRVAPVSVAPARRSDLAGVGAFTFLGVFVLWCGALLALAALIGDLRQASARLKASDRLARSLF